MAMSISEQQDVLAARAGPACVQADKIMELLTEYGKAQALELAKGRQINPELVRRMKMLVNQEYRILTTCHKVEQVCQEILETCSSNANVSEDQLQPFISELMEFFTDVAEEVAAKKDNVNAILSEERASLQKFQDMHGPSRTRRDSPKGLLGQPQPHACSCPVPSLWPDVLS